MNETDTMEATSGTVISAPAQVAPEVLDDGDVAVTEAPVVKAPLTEEQKAQMILRKELKLAVIQLRARTGNEWNKLVGSFNDRALQVKVASIVWWDFFSNRNITQRWEELDEFLIDAFNPNLPDPSVEALRDGLTAVGYPPTLAAKRAQGYDY
jgi:hypothetical protein